MTFSRVDIHQPDPARPHCHCPVIIELPSRELVASWYAGKAEAHVSVAIVAARKSIDAPPDAWSPVTVVHETPGKPDGNAVLATFNDRLYLFHDVIAFPLFPWTNAVLHCKTSTDGGVSWTPAGGCLSQPVVPSRGITVRTKPLVLGAARSTGRPRMLVPVGSEHLRGSWSHAIITDDGETFRLSGRIVVPGARNEQPALCRLGDGTILAFLRTTAGRVYTSTSHDDGETWSTAEPTRFANPNSALDVARTADGELVLVLNDNPAGRGGTMKSRRCLSVAYSPDEGKTWPIIKEIERDDVDGSFAYPAIITGFDGCFHLVYNNRRRTTRYCRFDLAWLLGA